MYKCVKRLNNRRIVADSLEYSVAVVLLVHVVDVEELIKELFVLADENASSKICQEVIDLCHGLGRHDHVLHVLVCTDTENKS